MDFPHLMVTVDPRVTSAETWEKLRSKASGEVAQPAERRVGPAACPEGSLKQRPCRVDPWCDGIAGIGTGGDRLNPGCSVCEDVC